MAEQVTLKIVHALYGGHIKLSAMASRLDNMARMQGAMLN